MTGQNPSMYVIYGIVIFIGGYFVRSYLAKRSQRIKDLRSKVDTIASELDDIEDLSMSYFLKAGSDEGVVSDGLRITSKLKRVGMKINAIHQDRTLTINSRNASILTRMKNLRQAISKDDFDSVDRVARKANDKLFSEISDASAELKSALEAIYNAVS